ncbi:hypothetical protein QBC34DRAFT_329814 [Podospora aff. communis PSN243]|uniref:Autophagy-related protein 6 n=1 Tax=Podospora aff. communis PSN243 TaxID=3040156 RepID=A0AAV9GLK4_9PEZI|nr:hypothetical protein QBC34DRAFT_329814 [Podospora aff. communis PSN243]
MGWFDGWFGGSSSGSDPLGKLDPNVRKYLEKESPVKLHPHDGEPSPSAPPQPQKPTASSDDADLPPVPPQSLFQDGRYAHLWKTYRPLAALEAETKTDHEKLMDVLEAFKERKAKIGRTAMENCAEEQFEWMNCMKEGEWTKRAKMCSDEVRAFERCYKTQTRLLKAMGYLSSYQRPPEVDEQIQMRADKIYQDMIANEREAAKAKDEGRPVPVYMPAIPKQEVPVDGAAAMQPGPEKLKEWKEILEKLPVEERAAEEEALRAEFRAKSEVAAGVQSIWDQRAKEREARKAEGKETMMDKVKDLIGK